MKQDTRYLPVQKALQGILATVAFPCAVHAELLNAQDRCPIFSQNSNLPFGAASIIKLPLLVCVAQLVELGELAWDRSIRLTVPAPHGTGLLEHLDRSRQWSVQDLCIMMMGVSDNMACNQLIEEIGIERLSDVLRGLGYKAISIRRRMMDYVAWPLPGSAVRAVKTGGMSGSLLDAELVTVSGGPTYLLCVFASGFERAAQAKRVMAEVSEMIYSTVSGSRCGEQADSA